MNEGISEALLLKESDANIGKNPVRANGLFVIFFRLCVGRKIVKKRQISS